MKIPGKQLVKFLWVALAIVLVACGPSQPPATETPAPTPTTAPTDTPEPPKVRPIVFVSNRGDDPDQLGLYTLNPETSEISFIDTGFDFVGHPSLSPDGTTIAFWSDDSGEELIYTINVDGTNLVQITDYSSAMPNWSPDGERLVFQSDHQNEPKDTPDIYIMDKDGGNMEEFLDDPDVPDYSPQWTPDGEAILFVSRRTGNDEIFLMDMEGNATQITESGTPAIFGSLSPDGQKVVFEYGAFGMTDLFVMNLDETEVVRLTQENRGIHPAFSPDGSQIVFYSDRSGNWDLWLINIDGSGLTQLTDDEYYDALPDW